MLYFCITLVFFCAAWIVYSSRNLLLLVGGWMLRRRYAVELDGADGLELTKTYLIIPNHPAIVDPLIVTIELHRLGIDIRPLVDESFFSNRMVRHILALFDAVRVPDFRRSNFRPILKVRPTLHNSARRARALGYTILATLTGGGNVLLYPSGHITADGRESLSNRQLAFNVISQLPQDVRVLGIRTRGLYGSMWSRVGGRPAPPFATTFTKGLLMWTVTGFRRKRRVTMHLEDMTAQVRAWTSDGRQEFNRRLETWYDADLAQNGLDREPVT